MSSDTTAAEKLSGALTLIRSGVPERMLLLVIGGGAGIVSYRRLADHMSTDWSIAASQLPGLGPQSPESKSIEKMADAHLAAVIKETSASTYGLIGHSMGGNVALELGRKLDTLGKRVAFVCVVDQAAPQARVSWRDWLFWQKSAIAQLPARQRWRYIQDGIRYRLRSSRWLPRWCRFLFFGENQTDQNRNRAERQTANEFRMGLLEASLIALREHRPAPVGFPFILVRAQSGSPLIQADPRGGWGAVALGPFGVVDVPGHHMNIFAEENVSCLASELERFLESTDDNSRE